MDGAVLWEQTRREADAMFVETNLSLAALTGSHTNSAVINGKDAGDMVEEYQQSYMTKEKGGLVSGTAMMLTALNDIENHPSVADDHGTYVRQAKHLATRTVNAFTGGTEWPHALMVYALAGHRSFLSSDTFWYVFPHKLVEALRSSDMVSTDSNTESDSDDDQGGSSCSGDTDGQSDDGSGGHPSDEEMATDVNETLEAIVAVANDDVNGQQSRGSSYSGSGARMFRVGDQIVLVTQAQSYRHRGQWFEKLSALEFEAIVDILPRCDDEQDANATGRGRPKRRGFDLGCNHPLAPHFQGFIRAKFKTTMLGGPPPPSVSKNGQPTESLSKYILSLLYPWSISDDRLPFRPSPKNLLRLCREWNNSTASFVDTHRYRVMSNILHKHHRSHTNEKVCSEWRSRNADIWNEAAQNVCNAGSTNPPQPPQNNDPEVAGQLSLEDRDLYALAKAAAAKDQATINAVRALRATFSALIPPSENSSVEEILPTPVMYRDHFRSNLQITKLAKGIQAMAPRVVSTCDGASLREVTPRLHNISDTLESDAVHHTSRHQCSADQQQVFDTITESIDGGKLRQTLTVLHGGGGTGKSTLIRRISKALSAQRIETICTCPTGAGASHLDNGRTIHSAFKLLKKTDLTANDLEPMRLISTDRVWLIVIDEVSMLSTEHLVLIDARLRAIYKNNLKFGGRSIILAGDFLQLDVPGGTALCKMMYKPVKSQVLLSARGLFREFSVFFLIRQHRAAGCSTQKTNLLACRSLPSFYPSGVRYTPDERKLFRPITRDIARTIATEISMEDLEADPGWLDETTILVTNNTDKAALTPCTATLYPKRNSQILFRWQRQTKIELLPELHRLVYDEDAQPELFAYFVVGARAQILDNNNGNVGWCIANGTSCRLHSLAWEDQGKTDQVSKLVENARLTRSSQVDLPFPPDFINVQFLDECGELMTGKNWPVQNNLETEWISSADGKETYKRTVIIPIGLMSTKSRKKTVHLGSGTTNPVEIEFIQHAVDLALVMTVWKSQGSTLKRVFLDLEPTRANVPKWGFEHIYVGTSRVRAAKYLRCLPLTGAFRLAGLQNLRPNIYTTKWRLDNQPK